MKVFVILFLSVVSVCFATSPRQRLRLRREGGGWGAPQRQQSQQQQQSYQQQQQQQQYQPVPYTPYNNQPNYNTNQGQGQGQGQAEAPTVFPTECAAALLCVNEAKCDAKGVISERQITEPEKQFRVALSGCTHNETGEIGVCCRDPNYKDPWPDMNGIGQGHDHHHTKDSNGGQYKPQQQQPQQQYQQPQQQYQQPQQQQYHQPQQQQYQQPQQPVQIPASPSQKGSGGYSSNPVQCQPSY